MLTVLPKATTPPPVIPVEVEIVMELLTKSELPTRPLYKLPDEERTTPVPRDERVVEPVTESVPVTEVVAKKELPLTVRAVVEALAKVDCPVTNNGPEIVRAVAEAVCKEVCPDTVKRFEIVVDPVTAKVLEPELKVKLEEVAKVLLPWPNKISLAVKFWSWMVGVRPPDERMEPEPETEVTKVEEA